jgi:hypothetical protein
MGFLLPVIVFPGTFYKIVNDENHRYNIVKVNEQYFLSLIRRITSPGKALLPLPAHFPPWDRYCWIRI